MDPNRLEKTNAGRRAFLYRSGAAISGVLGAATVGLAERSPGSSDDVAAIRRLYREYAATIASQTVDPSNTEPVHVRLLHDRAAPDDIIVVAPDGQSASARFHCMVQTVQPLVGDARLIEMARLQGNTTSWWERGVHSLDCVKTGDGWKIQRMVYRPADQPDPVYF